MTVLITDGQIINKKEGMNMKLNVALCNGRHPIPQAIDGAIFRGEIQNMTDVAYLEESAFYGLWNAAYRHYKGKEEGFLYTSPEWNGEDAKPLAFCPNLEINIYVTGLTVALIAALNVCKREHLNVTLWHFNRETGNYFPQPVV